MLILLDQNVPRSLLAWFQVQRPSWSVFHTSQLDLGRATDEEVGSWALSHEALVVTFDEDFLDRRVFQPGSRPAVVRLRVWPTTPVVIEHALKRLIDSRTEDELMNSVTIVDRSRIRSVAR
jgi:predicted nuclease of predicted toxin-antitoxin system